MQRYNAFLLIHKGLRAMLYDVSLQLQHTDFAIATECPGSFEKLSMVLDIFDAHACHEDRFLFCLLESCDPALLNEMGAEHVEDHALSHELRSLIARYIQAKDEASKSTLGNVICYAFNAFIAFNLTHLNKEESIVNEALWKHYTDFEILTANQNLISSLTPDEAKRNAVWMVRSCSNHEIINWINAIKNNIPQPILHMLLQLIKDELPAQRHEVILKNISKFTQQAVSVIPD